MRLRLLVAALSLAVAPLARGAHFTHNPETSEGPDFWGTVEFPWATCGTVLPGDPAFVEVGTKQSPVDIVAPVDAPLSALAFLYSPAPFVVVNNGHAVQVNFPPGSVVRIGQDVYELLQLHMHAPSEHAVGSRLAALELHLVHRDAFGDLAVVGVLFDTALPPNALIEEILLNAPIVAGTSTTLPGRTIDPTALLPETKGYYAYSGSLTTPPCSEGVRWSVLDTPVGISQTAVNRMHDIVAAFPLYEGWPDNNRPVRPLNGRAVFHKK